jgi:hypothetical protein
VKTVSDTLTDEELQTNTITLGINKGNTKFSMQEITVDGIYGKRPNDRVYDSYLFTLKDEQTEDGGANDTGEPFYWKADFTVSEQHWLTCNAVISRGSRCYVCNEVAE